MAEGFSRAGVPVFCADVKGDLSGISMIGTPQDFLLKRAQQIGFTDYANAAFPTIFWDLFGAKGHPVRTTISEMGPLLLSRILSLNDTQEGVLNVAFKYADDNGLLLLDLKDLRALLVAVDDNSKEISATYGNIATATVGTIQRALLVLEQQGATNFFGEKALDINDLMRLALAVQQISGNITGVDRLDQQVDSRCSGLARRPGQVLQINLAQCGASHACRHQPGHHMQARASQRQRIGQSLFEDAAPELVASLSQTGNAALAAGKVAGWRVEQHLLQAVIGQATGDRCRFMLIGKQEFDRIETIRSSRSKAIEESMFHVHHRQIGGKARHGHHLAPKAL